MSACGLFSLCLFLLLLLREQTETGDQRLPLRIRYGRSIDEVLKRNCARRDTRRQQFNSRAKAVSMIRSSRTILPHRWLVVLMCLQEGYRNTLISRSRMKLQDREGWDCCRPHQNSQQEGLVRTPRRENPHGHSNKHRSQHHVFDSPGGSP